MLVCFFSIPDWSVSFAKGNAQPKAPNVVKHSDGPVGTILRSPLDPKALLKNNKVVTYSQQGASASHRGGNKKPKYNAQCDRREVAMPYGQASLVALT